MNLNDILIESELNALFEAPLDMPEGADMVRQLEILMHRLETAKKALGITNRLTNPVERKRHRSRVMGFMNQLRAAFNRVADQLEAEMQQEEPAQTAPAPEMRMAA